MTYDTALNFFAVVAIPAIVFVSYKLFTMSRNKRQDTSHNNPFVYEIDPVTGEIVFGDEKKHASTGLPEERPETEPVTAASMVDVLSPGEMLTDDSAPLAGNKSPEEAHS